MMKTLQRKFALLMLLVPLGLVAQVSDTEDKFVITPGGEVVPGGEAVYFDVSVEGSRLYTAYNMDIFLPQGMSFAKDTTGKHRVIIIPKEGGGIYPYTETKNEWTGAVNTSYTHAVQFALQDNGAMRVTCKSDANENFTATSGPLFRVYFEASPYAKPGVNEVRMTGLNLTAVEDGKVNKYVPNGDLNTGEITVSSDTISMVVNISPNNKYGTCLLPFAVTTIPEGLEVFTPGTIENDVLPLVPVTSMEAYKPYILYAPNGITDTFTGKANADDYPEGTSVTLNGLTGLLVQQMVSEGYILQNKGEGEGPRFYAVGSTPFLLPAGKCYLSLPAESAARLTFQLPATGIGSVCEDALGGVFYDLQGRRVENLQPGGIYISDKRKIFVNN